MHLDLMPPDEHFKAAVRGDGKAASKEVRYTSETAEIEPQAVLSRNAKTPVVPGFASNYGLLPNSKLRGQDSNLRPRGYEPRELPGCSTPRCVPQSSCLAGEIGTISAEGGKSSSYLGESPRIGKMRGEGREFSVVSFQSSVRNGESSRKHGQPGDANSHRPDSAAGGWGED